MSAQAASTYRDQAQQRPLPATLVVPLLLLLLVGLALFGYGLVSDPAAAWRAFHVNYLYFAGISQGGLIIACALTIVGARWAGPVRRIAESLAVWAPLTFVLAACDWFFGGAWLYPWRADFHGAAELLPWKDAWLNPTRFVLVDLGIYALLAVLSLLYLRASLRPALHGVQASGLAGRLFQRWSADWRGEQQEHEASLQRTRVLAPIICLVYAFGYSIIGFDQVMSLEPTWFSNLFGGFFAWGAFLSAISVTTVLTVLHRNAPGFAGSITKSRLHDLGKMVFAFSIFWMYLFFSQYLVIWYGNLPEETAFFKDRLGTEFLMSTWYWEGWWDRILGEPWVRITLTAWIAIWVIPFWCLLGQRPKQNAAWLGSVALVSALGFWLERNVLVWPSLAPQDTWAFWGAVQLGTALAFFSAFALTWLLYARVFPTLAVPKQPSH